MPLSKRINAGLMAGLKAIITIFLLWLAFRQVSWHQFRAALTQVSPWLTILAVLLYQLGAIIPDSVRLAACARQLSAPRISLRFWTDLYLESRPWFYLLPASAATDGFMWVKLKGKGWTPQGIASLLSLNRLWGMAIWALAAGVALIWDPIQRSQLQTYMSILASPWLWGGIGLTGIGVTVLGPLFLKRWFPDIDRLDLRDSLLAALSTFAGAFLLTMSTWVTGQAAGVPLPFLTCLGLMAWFNFGMILPISFGGLGIQEGLVLLLGKPSGIPIQQLLAFSILLHGLRLVLVITGAVVSFVKVGTAPAKEEAL